MVLIALNNCYKKLNQRNLLTQKDYLNTIFYIHYIIIAKTTCQ